MQDNEDALKVLRTFHTEQWIFLSLLSAHNMDKI